jgi:energy-coupling factor transporter ATP-binding protein EcfA2
LDEWGLSHRSEDRVSQLSAGLRRRLSVLSGMAPALFCETPRIVFLDEPSEGLDLFSKSLLKSWIEELSANGNAVVMASHDEDVISCSTRILKVDEGRISETMNQIEISGFNERKLSAVTSRDSIRSFFSWGVSIERRNPVDTIGKATPAILALLLSYSIVGRTNISDSEFDLFSALILAPAFISAIVSPAMIRRLNEEDCGKWWSAICGPQFRPATSVLASSIILPIPLTYLSWFVLEGLITGEVDQNAIYWLWLPSLVIIDISCASTALHMLVSDLRRSSAAAASLLLVVLVWPFIQVVDALSMILDNGMTWEFSTSSPLMSLIFASVISAMVWAVAIFIPDA